MALNESRTVSERHAEARADEAKITAGQLAQHLRRRGHQVTARDLAEFAPEWHHSGWRADGKGMGRTFFFPRSILDDEPAKLRLIEQVAAQRAETGRERFYFVTRFRACYDGRYGRKRYQPIAEIGMVAAGKRMPKRAVEITREQYKALLPHGGEDLAAYESLEAFASRMGNRGPRPERSL